MKIHKVCAGLLASIADSSTLFISRVNLSQSSTTTAVADVAEHTYPPILHKKPIYVVKKPFSLAQRGNIERQRPISVEICLSEKGTHYKAQGFCGEKFDAHWQRHHYPAYQAEFNRLSKQYKWRAGDGKKISKEACKTYKLNWDIGNCEESEGKRWLCCQVHKRLTGHLGAGEEDGWIELPD